MGCSPGGTRRDHDGLVDQWLDRCQGFIGHILQAPDLQSVANASLALLAQMRPVARDILQAKLALEAPQLTRADITPCCPEAAVTLVHTRTVRPAPLFGEIIMPVRTCQWRGCGATFRPDDTAPGVPAPGDFTADVRDLYAPLATELPHRGATPLFARGTGGTRSSCGAQGIMDSTAEALQPWQVVRARQQTAAVADALEAGNGASDLRREIAMEGVTAHIDGRWRPPKGATILVRQREAEAEGPTLGAVLARRDVSVLGAADDLAVRIKPVLREAGWEHIPLGEILGAGAPWLWNLAEAHFPGVRQRLDDSHLSAHLSAVAPLLYPNNPAGAKAWVDQTLGALLTDRVGEGRGALKRMRPWNKALHEGLAQLLGSVEHNRPRLRYQAPWHTGLAVGAGAVEGACKPVIHRRFKRAGMRWKQPGVLNVLALRLASLKGTFEAFWASRGLALEASVAPTK